MRRSLISAGALVAAVAGSLVLAPAASASEGPKVFELPLHQPTPITAAGFEKGECKTIPSDKDGWHFIIPGGGKDPVEFTKLTVTFDNGAPIVITDFGPPKDDHAYVASEPGAKLTSAVAEVNGEVSQGFFNLSHTCPASSTPNETPTGTPSGTPSETPSETTSGTPSGTPSVTPSESVAPTNSPGTSETPGGTESPSATTPARISGSTCLRWR